jgi:archaea-specific RecJ-like exonuclease
MNAIKTEFMAHSDLFEKMRPKMEAAANRILTAIQRNQRIVVKHHNDCDGFCSGLALESAIIPIIKSVNSRRTAVNEKFKRMASFSPFYNVEDAIKDVASFLSIGSKFDEEMPLVILTDLGSGPENILPIKQLKAFGCDVIVIDHHPVDSIVDSLVDYHINPHLFDFPNELSAGILCSEISRMLYTVNSDYIKTIAAVSAISDRVEEQYATAYIESSPYDKATLQQIGRSMDFVVYHLRNMDATEILDVLLGKQSKQQQTKLLELYTEELQKREAIVIEQAMPLVVIEKIGATFVATLPVDQLQIKDNYPRMGIVVDIVKEKLLSDGKISAPFVMFGTTPILQLCRASDDSAFDFPTLLKLVQTEVPLSFAEGGGHPHAGTFRYVETQRVPVHAIVRDYVSKL